jgi:hypothetical protein
MKLLCVPALALLASAAQETAPEKLPLRVLYAGNADSKYSEAWTEFLGRHTAGARFVALSELKVADFSGRDVVLIDGEVDLRNAGGEQRLRIEKLDLSLDDVQGVPVVLMGGQGGAFADELKLKLSWGHG